MVQVTLAHLSAWLWAADSAAAVSSVSLALSGSDERAQPLSHCHTGTHSHTYTCGLQPRTELHWTHTVQRWNTCRALKPLGGWQLLCPPGFDQCDCLDRYGPETSSLKSQVTFYCANKFTIFKSELFRVSTRIFYSRPSIKHKLSTSASSNETLWKVLLTFSGTGTWGKREAFKWHTHLQNQELCKTFTTEWIN